jgi:hypothetical protein
MRDSSGIDLDTYDHEQVIYYGKCRDRHETPTRDIGCKIENKKCHIVELKLHDWDPSSHREFRHAIP